MQTPLVMQNTVHAGHSPLPGEFSESPNSGFVVVGRKACIFHLHTSFSGDGGDDVGDGCGGCIDRVSGIFRTLYCQCQCITTTTTTTTATHERNDLHRIRKWQVALRVTVVAVLVMVMVVMYCMYTACTSHHILQSWCRTYYTIHVHVPPCHTTKVLPHRHTHAFK